MFIGDHRAWIGFIIRLLFVLLIIAVLSLPLLQFFLK